MIDTPAKSIARQKTKKSICIGACIGNPGLGKTTNIKKSAMIAKQHTVRIAGFFNVYLLKIIIQGG
jgi:nucleoside-triphosphatase THEP1